MYRVQPICTISPYMLEALLKYMNTVKMIRNEINMLGQNEFMIFYARGVVDKTQVQSV